MPTLLEVQNALRKNLVDREDGEAALMLAEHVPPDRLDIYRNTFITASPRRCAFYPAVHRLVGDDFFAAAAGIFIARNPPRAAYLDQYGAQFPNSSSSFRRPLHLPIWRMWRAWNGPLAKPFMRLTTRRWH